MIVSYLQFQIVVRSTITIQQHSKHVQACSNAIATRTIGSGIDPSSKRRTIETLLVNKKWSYNLYNVVMRVCVRVAGRQPRFCFLLLP